jgi:hypothetical protein
MHILDYDEFNIYTTPSDVENYIEGLINEGIEIKEEIYKKCLSHFGIDLKNIIDDIFFYDEDL